MISKCEISISEALLESAREVFETMIYMSVEESDVPKPTEESECVNASIMFGGLITGGMIISCTADCAKTITANMLAMDDSDDIPKSDIFDAMSELANLLMGSVKTKVYDSYGDIKVSIPSILESNRAKLNPGDRNSELFLNIDAENTVKITIYYHQ